MSADALLTVCRCADLTEGAARGFQVAGVELLVLRQQDRLFLYHNRCPHLGIPLEWEADRFLDEDGAYIRCSNHGALFIKDSGQCVQGPCLGQSLLALPCHVEAGELRVPETALRGLA